MQLNFQDDWPGTLDNLVSATWKGYESQVALNGCVLASPVTWKELVPSKGYVTRHGQQFLWKQTLTPVPEIGSIVVDSHNTYWTIIRINRDDWTQTYLVDCLNLNIVRRPFNKATILKAIYTKGGANEALANWHGYFSGKEPPTEADTVLARIQPAEEASRIDFDAEYSQEGYRCYFKDPVPMQLTGGEYRIVDTEGHRFRVVRYFNEERIDTLPVAVLTKITEGVEYEGGNGP